MTKKNSVLLFYYESSKCIYTCTLNFSDVADNAFNEFTMLGYVFQVILVLKINLSKQFTLLTFGSRVLRNLSITSHFSFTSSTCFPFNGSRIRNLTSSLPPIVFLPSINWNHTVMWLVNILQKEWPLQWTVIKVRFPI